MDMIVLCHKLEFPKYLSTAIADVSNPEYLLEKLPNERTSINIYFGGASQESPRRGNYGILKCGPSKSTAAYVCYKCNKIFTNIRAVRSHTRSHPDFPFSCGECGQNFLCQRLLEVHSLKHLSSFECEYCGKKFTKDACHEFVKHKDTKHSAKCSHCDLSFISERRLNRHRKKQHPETLSPFLCAFCDSRFSSKRKLAKHHLMHEKRSAERLQKQYRCPVCREICCGKQNLSAHYRLTHMVRLQVHDDDMNNESSAVEDKPTEDTERQEEEKGDEAVNVDDLKVTFGKLYVDETQTLYVCYACDRYFDHSSELQDHMKIHAEGSTVCNKCEFDLSTLENLKIHQKLVHLHQCNSCYLSFVKNSHRKKHKKCHEELAEEDEDADADDPIEQ